MNFLDKSLHMKKFSIVMATAALPFLLVWAATFLTGFSFNPINVFQNGTFWGVSVLYWFLWVCLLGPIVDLVDVSVEDKPKQIKTLRCPRCETHIGTL